MKCKAPARGRTRRSQEERSATTRAQLLDATLQCLSEHGYAQTTTTDIAERAGVSRGAQLHHFPSKAELVTHAVEYLLDKRTEQFRDAFAALPVGANRISAGIDILWSVIAADSFYPWLELIVAARTDRALLTTVTDIERRFAASILPIFRELFPAGGAPSAAYELVPMFTFAVLRGFALEQVAAPAGDSRVASLLELFKALVSNQTLVPELHGGKS